MRFLITNDDGILAPGLAALHEAASALGPADVVAPEDTQSAIGHAISVLQPMVVRRLHVNNQFHGWSVGGRPADCVKLAMIELLPERPDVVLSGINAGANAGINVLYSGTIAGAREGALFGVPAIAFSLELCDELDFGAAGRVARSVLEAILAARPPAGICLSVNIPRMDRGLPRGVKCCAQAAVNWEEFYEKRVAPEGHAVYWLDGRIPHDRAHPDSDLAALHDGYVTITPLRADLTDQAALDAIASWRWPHKFG